MQKQQNVVAILALTLLAATTTASAQQPSNICQGVGNNIFLTDVDNCTNYYWCNNGQAVLQECQPVNGQPTYFNGTGQSCVYDNSACLQCPPNQLTFERLAHSCNSYIMCFSGIPLIQTCADNLQWDESAGACNFPGLVDCVSDQCSVYSDASNVVYIPSQQSCSTYYICMRGVAISQSCVKNTQWNPAINKCDVPANVNCTLGATSRSAALPVPVEAQLVNLNCPATGEHYYPHPQELNKYYMCVAGKGALLTCAKGLLYDAEAKQCRDLQNIAMF